MRLVTNRILESLIHPSIRALVPASHKDKTIDPMSLWVKLQYKSLAVYGELARSDVVESRY
jgi:hypothetical protein